MVILGSASPGGWFKVAFWTGFGTLMCVVVSVAYNWVMFAGMAAEAQWQGLNSAIVLPLVLATPSFFILMVMLRELGIANGRLDELASFDMLTGCLNRRAFTAAVEKRLAEGRDGALLVVDADRFKAVNDCFGHDGGDEALRLIASSIRSTVRSGDQVGRLGGEEFGIYLPDACHSTAAEAAERIRAAVSGAAFMPSGKRHRLSVSIGCAVHEGPADFDELFSLADKRLYAAKRHGRDRVELVRVPALVPELERMAS